MLPDENGTYLDDDNITEDPWKMRKSCIVDLLKNEVVVQYNNAIVCGVIVDGKSLIVTTSDTGDQYDGYWYIDFSQSKDAGGFRLDEAWHARTIVDSSKLSDSRWAVTATSYIIQYDELTAKYIKVPVKKLYDISISLSQFIVEHPSNNIGVDSQICKFTANGSNCIAVLQNSTPGSSMLATFELDRYIEDFSINQQHYYGYQGTSEYTSPDEVQQMYSAPANLNIVNNGVLKYTLSVESEDDDGNQTTLSSTIYRRSDFIFDSFAPDNLKISCLNSFLQYDDELELQVVGSQLTNIDTISSTKIHTFKQRLSYAQPGQFACAALVFLRQPTNGKSLLWLAYADSRAEDFNRMKILHSDEIITVNGGSYIKNFSIVDDDDLIVDDAVLFSIDNGIYDNQSNSNIYSIYDIESYTDSTQHKLILRRSMLSVHANDDGVAHANMLSASMYGSDVCSCELMSTEIQGAVDDHKGYYQLNAIDNTLFLSSNNQLCSMQFEYDFSLSASKLTCTTNIYIDDAQQIFEDDVEFDYDLDFIMPLDGHSCNVSGILSVNQPVDVESITAQLNVDVLGATGTIMFSKTEDDRQLSVVPTSSIIEFVPSKSWSSASSELSGKIKTQTFDQSLSYQEMSINAATNEHIGISLLTNILHSSQTLDQYERIGYRLTTATLKTDVKQLSALPNNVVKIDVINHPINDDQPSDDEDSHYVIDMCPRPFESVKLSAQTWAIDNSPMQYDTIPTLDIVLSNGVDLYQIEIVDSDDDSSDDDSSNDSSDNSSSNVFVNFSLQLLSSFHFNDEKQIIGSQSLAQSPSTIDNELMMQSLFGVQDYEYDWTLIIDSDTYQQPSIDDQLTYVSRSSSFPYVNWMKHDNIAMWLGKKTQLNDNSFSYQLSMLLSNGELCSVGNLTSVFDISPTTYSNYLYGMVYTSYANSRLTLSANAYQVVDGSFICIDTRPIGQMPQSFQQDVLHTIDYEGYESSPVIYSTSSIAMIDYKTSIQPLYSSQSAVRLAYLPNIDGLSVQQFASYASMPRTYDIVCKDLSNTFYYVSSYNCVNTQLPYSTYSYNDAKSFFIANNRVDENFKYAFVSYNDSLRGCGLLDLKTLQYTKANQFSQIAKDIFSMNVGYFGYFNGKYTLFATSYDQGYVLKFSGFGTSNSFVRLPDVMPVDAEDLVCMIPLSSNSWIAAFRNYLCKYTFEDEYSQKLEYLYTPASKIGCMSEYYRNSGRRFIASDGSQVLSSNDLKNWESFLVVGDQHGYVDMFKQFDDNTALLFKSGSDDAGLYSTHYDYYINQDTQIFNAVSAQMLYKQYEPSALMSCENAMFEHESIMHAPDNSMMYSINSMMCVDFNNLGDFTNVDDSLSTPDIAISNDYIENVLTGHCSTADDFIRAAVKNNVVGTSQWQLVPCDYIAKCWRSGLVELYIYVSTTHTYYIPHVQGAGYCPDSNLSVRANGKLVPATVEDNTTSLNLQILTAYFNFEHIYENTVKGNSLPLKVYKDTIDNAPRDRDAINMWHSFALPSIASEFDTTKLVDGQMHTTTYYCFGSDAQAIKIVGFSQDNKRSSKFKRVIYHANGGYSNLYKNVDQMTQYIFEDDEDKHILSGETLFGNNGAMFSGWSLVQANDGNGDERYAAGTSVSYDSINGDWIDLYATWILYKFSDDDTIMQFDAFENSKYTIAEIIIDPSIVANGVELKNKLMVEFDSSDGPTPEPDPDEPIEVKFIVTFNANGGTCDEQYREVDPESSISILPNASKPGFTFDGWYTALADGNKVDESFVVSKDIALYAIYIANQAPEPELSYEYKQFDISCNASTQTATKDYPARHTTTSSSGICLTKWHDDFSRCIAYAKQTGIPMFYVISNGERCGHCTGFKSALTYKTFKSYMTSHYMIWSYSLIYGDKDLNGTRTENDFPYMFGWGYGSNGVKNMSISDETKKILAKYRTNNKTSLLAQYPFCGLYWYNPQTKKTICDVIATGDTICGEREKADGAKNTIAWLNKKIKQYQAKSNYDILTAREKIVQ